jgi:ketosteroid isomerase-like protein
MHGRAEARHQHQNRSTTETGDHVARTGDHVARTGDDAARTGDDVARTGDDATRMEHLVREYAAAKSRQDVRAALALCHPDFRLETVSLGVVAEGSRAAETQLALFFAAFPDYAVTLEDLACGERALAAWGRARLTLQGHLIGATSPCGTATLPIFCVFTFRDGLIASERFFFDLATLCEQAGVPVDLLREAASRMPADSLGV